MGRVYVNFLLLLLPLAVVGQTEYGIKGGLNISDVVMTNYIDPDVESDLDLKLGLHVGVYVSGSVNERTGMAAELLYSDKGVKGVSNIHLHYITMPLIVEYRLTDYIFGELGPEAGYLFSAKSKYGNVGNTYNNKFDLALDAGFRFNTDKLFLTLRYCAGLFSVRDSPDPYAVSGKEKIKYQNRVLQLSLGYPLWKKE